MIRSSTPDRSRSRASIRKSTTAATWAARAPGGAADRNVQRQVHRGTVDEAPTYDCVGLYGTHLRCPDSGVAAQVPGHIVYAPWNFDVSLSWRYVDGVKLDGTSSDPQLNSPGGVPATDAKIDSQELLRSGGEPYTFHGERDGTDRYQQPHGRGSTARWANQLPVGVLQRQYLPAGVRHAGSVCLLQCDCRLLKNSDESYSAAGEKPAAFFCGGRKARSA